LYQTVNNKIDLSPEITGIVSNQGTFLLPNRPVQQVTTPTGHSLRSNPFGQVNVVGTNGLFLVEAIINGNKYYEWLSIYKFNEAFWNGNTAQATYEITIPVSSPPANIQTYPNIGCNAKK
jgi:hypothetical protein